MADPIESIEGLRKHLEERNPVFVVSEDVLSRVPSRGQMVDGAGVFDPPKLPAIQLPAHGCQW